MQKKKTSTTENQSRENTTVSFLQKTKQNKSPHSILHIASVSLPVIIDHSDRVRWGMREQELPTQHRTESRDKTKSGDSSTLHPFRDFFFLSFFFQNTVQIFTDSGVMYKNENGRNLRHYARVFSISKVAFVALRNCQTIQKKGI